MPYALLIEHDGSHLELSLHQTQADAQLALRKIAEDVLSCYDLPALPAETSELIQYLVSFCEVVDVRLWRCEPNGEPGEPADLGSSDQAAAG
jgi:hypothetical protein